MKLCVAAKPKVPIMHKLKAAIIIFLTEKWSKITPAGNRKITLAQRKALDITLSCVASTLKLWRKSALITSKTLS